MLRRILKSILLILIIFSNSLVVSAQDSYEIIKNKNDDKVVIKVMIDETQFAGAEFNFRIQDKEGLKPLTFKLNDKLNASSIGLKEKDGVYYFGFYASENKFDGETYVGDLEFEYTGDKVNKIIFGNVLIARINEENKAEGDIVEYPIAEYIIKRAESSVKDPDGGGSSTRPEDKEKDKDENGKDQEVKEENGAPVIGLDKDNFVAYMEGYKDGTIRPESYITRAEAAAIFYRLLLPEIREKYHSTENEFIDVNPNQWHNVYISTLCNANILTGYGNNTFRPNQYLTRAEMVKVICQFEEMNGDYKSMFTDVEGHWAEKMINFATKSGWIKGYPDNTFKPDANITRAEVAAIINRYLGRSIPDDPDFYKNVKQWKDNPMDKWYYKDIILATTDY